MTTRREFIAGSVALVATPVALGSSKIIGNQQDVSVGRPNTLVVTNHSTTAQSLQRGIEFWRDDVLVVPMGAPVTGHQFRNIFIDSKVFVLLRPQGFLEWLDDSVCTRLTPRGRLYYLQWHQEYGNETMYVDGQRVSAYPPALVEGSSLPKAAMLNNYLEMIE